ncbi:5-methylcytosine-specific restriction endonuclease McrA [Siphonobacter aquaeclarae]|uniref:5-methylcytosine-specific restriction endonuclease McrA n=2 Tax=Siphonobacter aquaeclarae TaxID=563176 RepID=A0A1G9MXB9_9BACT|nr:5-methylcytosine-specific restriction endonuclease McrA [Siphonobacter aquaeclarae]
MLMGRKVLVLNQDYSALTICSVAKAFLLVYLKKADLIAESQNESLRSISQSFPLPTVIRLHKYVYLPYRGVMLTRQNIFRRDGNRCQYCGTSEDLTLDHMYPKSRGGKSSWDNLVTACKRCNSRKGDFTPEEAGMALRQRPFKPSFIMFIRDFSGIIDETWLPYLGRKEKKVTD